MVPLRLADRHTLGIAPDQVQDEGRNQPVMIDNVRLLDEAQGLEGQQFRIAWPGADDVYDTLPARTGKTGSHLGLGARKIAGIGKLRRPSRQRPLPEPAPVGKVRQRRLHHPAQPPGQRGELADPPGQQRLDLRPDRLRQYRRIAIRSDCNHDFAAIDDGRHGEIAKLRPVDHIERHPRGPDAGDRARIVLGHDGQPRRFQGFVEAPDRLHDDAAPFRIRQALQDHR